MNAPWIQTTRAVLFAFVAFAATTSIAHAQTALQHGIELNLLPGYILHIGQGIDSAVGKIVTGDSLVIHYEIGPLPKDGLRVGGSYINRAQQMPPDKRLWLRRQTMGHQRFYVAYTKQHRLVISTALKDYGINFTAEANTPGEITDVLLTVLTVSSRSRPAR